MWFAGTTLNSTAAFPPHALESAFWQLKEEDKGESVHYCWRIRPVERLSFKRASTKRFWRDQSKSGWLLMNFTSDVSNFSKIAAARGLNPWWFSLDGESAHFTAGVRTPHIDCWGAQVIAQDDNKAWKLSRQGVWIGLIRTCGMRRSSYRFVATGRASSSNSVRDWLKWKERTAKPCEYLKPVRVCEPHTWLCL